MSVPTHPQATADPQTLLWVVPGGLLPLGTIRRVPRPLQELVDAEVLTPPEVGAEGVRLTLPPGRTWAREAAGVRTALTAALDSPQDWEPTQRWDADATLAAVAANVLAGETGELVRSHGGVLRVAEVRDGVVFLDAAGTCDGCPAVNFTLQLRVAKAIRERLGGEAPVEVRLR